MADTWPVVDKVFPRAPRRSDPVSSASDAKLNIERWWSRNGSDIVVPLIDVPDPNAGSTVFPRAPRRSTEQTAVQAFEELKAGMNLKAIAGLALAGLGVYLIAR
jgi:hypothetical protein